MNKNDATGYPDLRTATVDQITEAFSRGVRSALREHKRAGHPVVVWDREQDRIVILRADQIEVPDESDTASNPAG
jgi:7-cyano-7-deazaguanine synthase in queuosine biosynthesis